MKYVNMTPLPHRTSPCKPRIGHFAVALLAAAGITSVLADDWPFYRGPARNGIAVGELKPLDDPEQVWKVNVGGQGKGGVTIADGRLFTQANGEPNLLTCLDAKTGETLWTHPTGRSDSTPSVHGGKVFLLDNSRVVHCIDAKSGEEIWKTGPLPDSEPRQGWGHTGSPVIWEDLVIVNVGYGAALKIDSGEVAWRRDGQSGLATPVLFSHRGKPAVAVFGGNALVASDARGGDHLWTIPWKSNESVNAADPIFIENDSKVFISSAYGLGRALYDLSGDEPRELWNYKQGEDGGAAAFACAIYHHNKLLVFTGSGFGPVDLETGKFLFGRNVGGSVIAFGQQLLTMSGGEIIISTLQEDKLEEILRAQVATGKVWNVPAYADGNLYARNEDGDVFCVKISE